MIVWLAHDTLGWHTELVTSAPVLVLLGGVGGAFAGEAFYHLDFLAIALAAAEGLVAAVVFHGFKDLRPDQWTRLVTSLETRLLADRPTAEVQSIFSNSGGWLLLFGLILLLALPYLLGGLVK